MKKSVGSLGFDGKSHGMKRLSQCSCGRGVCVPTDGALCRRNEPSNHEGACKIRELLSVKLDNVQLFAVLFSENIQLRY